MIWPLFHETVERSDSEVEDDERHDRHVHKMALTLIDVINHSPELQEMLANYDK